MHHLWECFHELKSASSFDQSVVGLHNYFRGFGYMLAYMHEHADFSAKPANILRFIGRTSSQQQDLNDAEFRVRAKTLKNVQASHIGCTN